MFIESYEIENIFHIIYSPIFYISKPLTKLNKIEFKKYTKFHNIYQFLKYNEVVGLILKFFIHEIIYSIK
jgi:hypothetical protein